MTSTVFLNLLCPLFVAHVGPYVFTIFLCVFFLEPSFGSITCPALPLLAILVCIPNVHQTIMPYAWKHQGGVTVHTAPKEKQVLSRPTLEAQKL